MEYSTSSWFAILEKRHIFSVRAFNGTTICTTHSYYGFSYHVSRAKLIVVFVCSYGHSCVELVTNLRRSQYSDSTRLIQNAESFWLDFEYDTDCFVAV